MNRAWVANITDAPPTDILTEPERQYCDRFVHKSDRDARIGVRALAKFALESNSLERSEIAHQESGAPYFVLYPNLHLSLAHTDGVVAVAISEDPIGIDVENVTRNTDYQRIAQRFFSDSERVEVLLPTPDRDLFYELWTRKEAVLKAEKKGLSVPLNTVTFSKDRADGFPYILTTTKTDNWMYSVASIGRCAITDSIVG